jgi:hypothetical protein
MKDTQLLVCALLATVLLTCPAARELGQTQQQQPSSPGDSSTEVATPQAIQPADVQQQPAAKQQKSSDGSVSRRLGLGSDAAAAASTQDVSQELHLPEVNIAKFKKLGKAGMAAACSCVLPLATLAHRAVLLSVCRSHECQQAPRHSSQRQRLDAWSVRQPPLSSRVPVQLGSARGSRPALDVHPALIHATHQQVHSAARGAAKPGDLGAGRPHNPLCAASCHKGTHIHPQHSNLSAVHAAAGFEGAEGWSCVGCTMPCWGLKAQLPHSCLPSDSRARQVCMHRTWRAAHRMLC